MAKTHPRDGSTALLSYNFSKGPEWANPLDPGSETTGNTRHVLNEIYESPAGIETTGKRHSDLGTTFLTW